MAKLIEYDQVETLKDEDVFLIDGERGTKTIAAKNLANDIKKLVWANRPNIRTIDFLNWMMQNLIKLEMQVM